MGQEFTFKIKGDTSDLQRSLERSKTVIEQVEESLADWEEDIRKITASQGINATRTEDVLNKLRDVVKEEKRIDTIKRNQNMLQEKAKSITQAIYLNRGKENKELKSALAAIVELNANNSEELQKLREINEEKEKRNHLDKEQKDIQIELRDKLRSGNLKGLMGSLNPMALFNKKINSDISFNDTKVAEYDKDIKDLRVQRSLLGNSAEDKETKKKIDAQISNLSSARDAYSSDSKKKVALQSTVNLATNALKGFGKFATGVFKTMGIDLKSIMSGVVDNIKKALDEKTGAATFATGSTIFTNSRAREQQMKYGLSNASNYALSQTKTILNMEGDEDLMYMNQTQKEIFNNLMDRYRGWYENLESTGAMVKLQEAQLEFKMFKQELSMKLLNWFANHKEAIFKILEITMNVLEFIANVVEGILNFFGKSVKSSSTALGTSDNYSSNTNSNININVNNTNNATANLNSKAELDNSLTASNQHLVKQIATTLTSR